MADIGNFKRPDVQDLNGEDAVRAFAGGALGSMVPDKEEKPNKPTPTIEQQQNRVEELEGLIQRFEQSPELTYEERLARHKITMEDAMNIVNMMIENNFYEREYVITKKHAVTFRTRLMKDQDTFLEKIEDRNPRFAPTIAHELAKHNLAVSVVKFKGVSFVDKPFKERYEFFNQMSETLLRLLAAKLRQFDELVADVLLDEGAIANF